jgi:hypothetical protein
MRRQLVSGLHSPCGENCRLRGTQPRIALRPRRIPAARLKILATNHNPKEPKCSRYIPSALLPQNALPAIMKTDRVANPIFSILDVFNSDSSSAASSFYEQ